MVVCNGVGNAEIIREMRGKGRELVNYTNSLATYCSLTLPPVNEF